MLKKFLLFVAMGTLVFSMAGCQQEPAEPETADEAIDQIEAEIEQLIAEEEAEEEAFREQPLQEYVPGTIPPGEYVYTYVTENGIEKERTLLFLENNQFEWADNGARSYTYDEATEIYTLDHSFGPDISAFIFTGRYENGSFIMLSQTYVGSEDNPDADSYKNYNYDASTSETEPNGRSYVRQ